VGLLLSKGDGSFAAEKAVALPNVSFGFAVGDFDGDGHEDLATANIQAGVSVRHGNGDATFRDGGEITAGRGPVELAVGDFDGDGTEDLAIADPDGGTVSVRWARARRRWRATCSSTAASSRASACGSRPTARRSRGGPPPAG
jgi:FG-GAP-like repeat